MKAWTFSVSGRGPLLQPGINTKADERFGQVVYLGQAGKGTRYEIVRLDRKTPAEVVGGRIIDAQPVKITLPQKDGKPEKVFYVLSKPGREDETAVLVRVDTSLTYTRDSHGYWTTLKGNPETLVAGSGTSGNVSSRIGSWKDGLVVMRPGDVLQVHPEGGYKTEDYVLYFSEGGLQAGLLKEWKAVRATERAASAIEERPMEELFGSMPAFSFGRTDNGWRVTNGIETVDVPGGRAVKLGPKDSGWTRSDHQYVGVGDEFPPIVTRAGLGRVGKNYVLFTSSKEEKGRFLVRVNSLGVHNRGHNGASQLRGTPRLIAKGYMSSGNVNFASYWDQLWVLSEGDMLRVGYESSEYPMSDYVVFVEDGSVIALRYTEWLLRDADKDLTPYLREGRVPLTHIPSDWVGRVVSIQGDDWQPIESPGVLLSLNPIMIDLGWDENPPRPFKIQPRKGSAWAKLLPDLDPHDEWVKTGERTEVVLADPVLPDRERRIAQVVTLGQKYAWMGGPQVWEYQATFEADADEVLVEIFAKGQETSDKRTILGQTRKVVTQRFSGTGTLSSGREGEIYGRLLISRASGKRGGDYWTIQDDHISDDEFASVQGQLEVVEAEAKRLIAVLAQKVDWTGKLYFTVDDTQYILFKDHGLVTVYEKVVYRGYDKSPRSLLEAGILQAWASSLGIEDAQPWNWREVTASPE